MADADILPHVLEPVTAAVIDAAPHLKLIQKIGIGVNTIDLDAARRRGIAICDMPGTNTQAVAEMTLLLMLAIFCVVWLSWTVRPAPAKAGSSSPSRRMISANCRAARWVWSGLAPSHAASCRCWRPSARKLPTRPGSGRDPIPG
jgi:hypothetical protein